MAEHIGRYEIKRELGRGANCGPTDPAYRDDFLGFRCALPGK